MTPKEQAGNLKSLGAKKTAYQLDKPDPTILETFLNSNPERNYVVVFESNEFTSLCPRTGAPDFADYSIRYVPDKECIESKSLKLYLGGYRNYGAFMERIANDILTDIIKACKPRGMVVEMNFGTRGGIKTTVEVTYFNPALSEDEQESIARQIGVEF